MTTEILVGTCVITVTVLAAIWKRIDVRLVLISAGYLLFLICGQPAKLFDVFMSSVGREDIIGPICTAMGYAYILKATGADTQMVRLLIHPIRKVRWLLIPGGCVIGFITNMAITSQTASAAAVGSILIPLMLAARFSPLAAAATLIVGCSVGGNLYNPGEPDIVAIHAATHVDIRYILDAAFLPNIISLVIATLALMFVIHRTEKKHDIPESTAGLDNTPINILQAILPPLPVLVLLLLQPGQQIIPVLDTMYPKGIPIATVMLCCSVVAMIVTRANVSMITREFFSGMGYAFMQVISLIIAATCFIEGLKSTGIIDTMANTLASSDTLAGIFSPLMPWTMAVISGSGTAPSVGFSAAILPTIANIDVAHAVRLGIMGAIGASLGRTMSPVAAITAYASAVTSVEARKITALVVWPMLASLLATIIYAVFWA